jgi:hypothetical protein
MTTETRSLHTKLAQIMYEAERIPKNGTAPQVMGGYRFVQVGDAADYIRKALAEHKITMLPTSVQVVGQVDRQTAKGGNMTTVDLLMEWTLTDGDSGESVKIMSFGAGADGGDKYSGKASTSAMKYALLTGFLLSTGDDTEGHATPEMRPHAPERKPASRSGGIVQTEAHPSPLTDDGGLIGTAITEGNYDFGLRQVAPGADNPTGLRWKLPFRVKNGSKSFIVVAEDNLAEVLAPLKEQVVRQRVTVFGQWSDETIEAKGTKPEIRYRILHLERIATSEFTLPAAIEAPSVGMFDDDLAALDAELDAAS